MRARMAEGEELFLEVLNEVGLGEDALVSRSREGIFTPALTMWLMMSQRTNGGRSLAAAVESLIAGEGAKIRNRNVKSRRLRVTDISLNSSAFSQARNRLSVETVRKVSRGIAEKALGKSDIRWHGKKVYLCDGTTLNLGSTKEILGTYKPVSNQYGTAYSPEMQCIFCHELFSGSAINPQFAAYRGAKALSEQQLCIQALDDFPEKSLLIADRNFGIFSVAYEAERRNIKTLVRLTTYRAKHVGGVNFSRKDNADIPVEWKFRSTRIPGLIIPENATVPGRFIKHTLRRKGFRDLVLYFFTTSDEPAEEIIELYAQRERIENDIRSLKYVVGMETLYGKTTEMLEKELLLGIAAYNLVRAIVALAAKQLNILPRQISFSRAARLTLLFGNQLSTARDKKEILIILNRFIKGLAQSKLPNRAYRRIEPRKVVRENQCFPLMRKSRKDERKEAMKTLKEYGHRGYFTTVSRNY